MSKNGIAWLPTKEERQIAKLDLAAEKRGQNYNIDLLPTKYVGNNIVNNPNSGGLVSGRPWTAGPPPASNATFTFQGDQNNWLRNGSFISGSTFSNPAPSNPAYTYPDNSYTGKTRNFDGTTWMASPNLSIGGAWASNTITIDFWFYPTATGVQLLSESNNPDVTSGYHYSMLEIQHDGRVKARFYNATYPGVPGAFAIVSQSVVELDAWNHIYFTEDSQGGHNFELNGVNDNINPTYITYTRIKPNIEYFIIGTSDATNMGHYGHFQGKIGYLNISDSVVASTYSTYVARFRPPPGSLPISAGIYSEVAGTLSDWALGTTWTMEWWGKANIPSAENRLMAVFGQNLGDTGIDIFQQRGKLYLGKSSYTDLGTEPTPGVWTHVAIVSNAGTVTVYYNGTSVYGPTAVGYNLTNSTDKLYVGVRSQGNIPITQQAFSGQLTGIRITNTAVYSGTFDPLAVALPPTKVTGTRLLINPIVTPATIVDSSDSAHGVGGISQVSQYYPPSVQLTSGTSLSFSGSNQDVQVTGTPTDWALGSAWTIEWWEKIPVGSGSDGFRGIMSQDSNVPPYAGIDIFHADNNIQLYNGNAYFAEPTRGVWNHVAVQKDGANMTAYVNGVSVGVGVSNGVGTLTNSSNDLIIGLRSSTGNSPGYSQWFKGKIANIRISNVVRYTAKFIPPTTVVVDNNTKLALDGSANAMLDDVSASNHTITNNGTTVTSVGTTTYTAVTPNNGTSPGTVYFLRSSYPGIENVPVGATMTGPIFPNPAVPVTITVSQAWNPNQTLWYVNYTPIPSGTSNTAPGDTFVFTW